MLMIYSRSRHIISAVVALFIITIVLNGINLGFDEKELAAKVKRVTLLDSSSSAYPAGLYLEIISEQGKPFYREISGPVIPKGTKITVFCSERLITGGVICEYKGNIKAKEVSADKES